MKILIPTCRPQAELADMIAAVAKYAQPCQVIVSGLQASASVNRNCCLDQMPVGKIGIMLDDDIEGFYPGWATDLTTPLFEDDSVVMVSARLMNPDGTIGPTCSRCYDPAPDEIEVKSNGTCILPTAAIAFRHRGHRFDENFIGSGFEDNDWMHQYLAVDPKAKFIQSNRCRLIHRNEMKNQKGKFWRFNQAYFMQKWHGKVMA